MLLCLRTMAYISSAITRHRRFLIIDCNILTVSFCILPLNARQVRWSIQNSSSLCRKNILCQYLLNSLLYPA